MTSLRPVAPGLTGLMSPLRSPGLAMASQSAYRSYGSQESVYSGWVSSLGQEAADLTSARPGYSEHQTGLCCDITDRYWEIKCAKTGDTDTFRWLEANCAQYGFILRFPDGKGELTGVMYEPFHFRYVGVEAAAYMTENKLCLEEFLALYGVE